MITLELSDQDWEDIAEELDDPEIDPRIRRKLMAIRMHGLGVPHGIIAATLNISDDTVTNYVKLCRDEGLGGLFENRRGTAQPNFTTPNHCKGEETVFELG